MQIQTFITMKLAHHIIERISDKHQRSPLVDSQSSMILELCISSADDRSRFLWSNTQRRQSTSRHRNTSYFMRHHKTVESIKLRFMRQQKYITKCLSKLLTIFAGQSCHITRQNTKAANAVYWQTHRSTEVFKMVAYVNITLTV